ncbi:hypothetical protein UCREL1_658 [Eutypa lata UCREL1]|uniref:Uncharacterized protein n=1 Tax=Eutypa lata (strain UCR-EL1) TaxID=1287681 RepID=M7T6N5_EUTLA|nr:hypothetical protein UCREL1_658 [Eutypa lata UCREL1]
MRRGTTPSNASAIAPTAARGGGGGMSLQRIIWTGAFAAVTIVGAIYGAGLKTQQEYKSEKKQVVQASVEDRIAVLENRRATLMSQKIPLDNKLAGLRKRMEAKEIQNAGRNGD